MMTRKARALGMTRTVYRNASGLPDDEQVTTARDQSTLGRAIQDRFPRYYRYFSTETFNYHGQSIRNHNHLLGNVEGVDGIKTGYTRASGFNLVTSMRRGNRHLVGVVMGGRSGGSRDAIMRNLLAENLDKAATTRTVAAITERNACRCRRRCRRSRSRVAADPAVQARGPVQAAAPSRPRRPPCVHRAPRSAIADRGRRSGRAAADRPRPEPAPLTTGVIQTQPIATIPGSSEPMKPVRVKTVQVKAGHGEARLRRSGPTATRRSPARYRAASPTCRKPRAPSWPRPNRTRPSWPGRTSTADVARTEMPPQPAGHGTGNGMLGVLPASSCHRASVRARRRWPTPIRSLAAAAGHPAERRHQAGRRPYRLDRPGRRARKRERSAAAHRSRAQPGPRPAQQGRSVHRAGRRQGQSEAVSAPASPGSSAIRPKRYAGP